MYICVGVCGWLRSAHIHAWLPVCCLVCSHVCRQTHMYKRKRIHGDKRMHIHLSSAIHTQPGSPSPASAFRVKSSSSIPWPSSVTETLLPDSFSESRCPSLFLKPCNLSFCCWSVACDLSPLTPWPHCSTAECSASASVSIGCSWRGCESGRCVHGIPWVSDVNGDP